MEIVGQLIMFLFDVIGISIIEIINIVGYFGKNFGWIITIAILLAVIVIIKNFKRK